MAGATGRQQTMPPASHRATHPGLARGVASGAAAGALWGLVFLAPQLLPDFGALQQSVARYLAYGLLALLLLTPRWRRATAPLGAAEWRALVVLSLLGNLLYFVLLVSAIHGAGGAAAALIVGLVPVVVTVTGARQQPASGPRLRALAGPCALSVLGMALVAVDAVRGGRGLSGDATGTVIGLACALGALASWSAYSVGNARWLAQRPEISSRDWSLLTGVATGGLALLLAPLALLWSAPAHDASGWLRLLAVSGALALFASVIGNGFWNAASRRLPLSLSGQMIVFETLFALLYGFLWEWRLPGMLEVAAVACLLAGVLWCTALHAPREVPAHAG